ncbi:hypothetical protein Hanom_Chr01g00051411 [Helianthus anomalus]
MAYIIVFFFILYVKSYLFSKHKIFFIFFALCALFLKKAHAFFCALRLGSGLGRCASPAPCVFDNIDYPLLNSSSSQHISRYRHKRLQSLLLVFKINNIFIYI